MFSSQTVLGTTRPIIVSHTYENQTVNGTVQMSQNSSAIFLCLAANKKTVTQNLVIHFTNQKQHQASLP
jgi:hypothetical protein